MKIVLIFIFFCSRCMFLQSHVSFGENFALEKKKTIR